MTAAAAVLPCFEREPGGGLCGDDGGLDTLLPASDEAGDGERSATAEEPCRRDDEPAAADVLGAEPSPTFLRGIVLSTKTAGEGRSVNCRQSPPLEMRGGMGERMQGLGVAQLCM